MIQTSPTSKQDSSGRRSRQLATPAEYHTLLETQKKSAITFLMNGQGRKITWV
ncbi:hypothetical protein [Fischerella thermalis]|uniref:hypothetical protein n=1 Tax=Fischerella thermalis TaxID=372787 RepID=UPI0002EA4A65|nr:hypothetical protein [Fischerella thermalis]